MLQPNPPGHHTTLNNETIERIINAIPEVIVQQQVAYRSKTHPATLSQWLKLGNRDLKEGKNSTLYAQLAEKYYLKRSDVLKQKLDQLAVCPKNYGAITWILEKCFKDDFEVMSEAHKQLLEWVEVFVKPLLRQGGYLHETENAEEAIEDTQKKICRSGSDSFAS